MEVTVLLIQAEGPERLRTVAALAEGCDPGQIATVADGNEAMHFLQCGGGHALRTSARQPRLLLVDLPAAAGLQFLEKLRTEPATAGLPVIVLLEPGVRGEHSAWYRAGANSVVLKSQDEAEMRRKMRRLREFWVDVNVANRTSRV